MPVTDRASRALNARCRSGSTPIGKRDRNQDEPSIRLSTTGPARPHAYGGHAPGGSAFLMSSNLFCTKRVVVPPNCMQ